MFLGNKKDPNFKSIVEDTLQKFQKLGCLMSLKVHVRHSHLDYFPENLCAVSKEVGERFHQDIKEMERRYQGKWTSTIIANYCWMLHRDEPNKEHKRRSAAQSMKGQKKLRHAD